MMGIHKSLLFTAICYGFAAASPVKERDRTDLCYVSTPRVAIVDSKLFFMGGKYTFNDGSPENEASLYSVDLTQKVSIDGPLPSDSLTAISIPASMPFKNNGAFFYTNDSLFTFAGFDDGDNSTATNTMWTYNTTTSKWSQPTISGGNLNHGSRDGGWFASDPASGKSWFMGGMDMDDQLIVPGLVKFDSTSMSWENETVANADGDKPPSDSEGSMAYVRSGKKGVLIGIGGLNTTAKSDNWAAWNYPYRHMDLIAIYDVDSSTWHEITATGDIPTSRTDFCTSVFASPDDSSFQLYTYGGWHPDTGAEDEDVYILTIPTFQWVRVTPSNDKESAAASNIGRSLHNSCVSWGERTMVAVGGDVLIISDGQSNNANANGCNSAYPPVKMLDASELAWLDSYDPKAAAKGYAVPQPVYAVVGGDENGNATNKTPQGGWDNAILSSIFAQTVARTVAPTAVATATPSPTAVAADRTTDTSTAAAAASSSPPSKNTSSAGPIAGGVVGGIAGLSAIIGILFFRQRRRAQKQTARLQAKWGIGTPELEEEVPGITAPEMAGMGSGREYFGNELDSHHPIEELPTALGAEYDMRQAGELPATADVVELAAARRQMSGIDELLVNGLPD